MPTKSRFAAIDVMVAEGLPAQLACRVLDVSESGFYAWRTRAPSERSIRHAWLTDLIHQVHADFRGVYGYRRVHAELDRGLLGVIALTGPPPRGLEEWAAATCRVDSATTVALGIDGGSVSMSPPLLFESDPLALRVRLKVGRARRRPPHVGRAGAAKGVWPYRTTRLDGLLREGYGGCRIGRARSRQGTQSGDAVVGRATERRSSTAFSRPPGVGKSTLVQYAIDSAPGFSVVRIAGVESEMALGYAGVHQLVLPILDGLRRLAEPQREALDAVLGRTQHDAMDMYPSALRS